MDRDTPSVSDVVRHAPGEVGSDEDPDQVIGRAVRAQWGHDPPRSVTDWLS